MRMRIIDVYQQNEDSCTSSARCYCLIIFEFTWNTWTRYTQLLCVHLLLRNINRKVASIQLRDE